MNCVDLCAVLAVVLCATACSPGRTASDPPAQPKAVRMGTVGASREDEPAKYSAILTPNAQVDLAFRVSGYVVELYQTTGADGRIRIEPLTKPVGTGLIKVVSMGFLSPEDEAIMWRGLMLLRGVQHFLEEVAWGDLDYLLVDMPPGTGDVQMGLARMLPRAEMLIVTTPALAAQKVAVRAADMARKGYLRVAGVIENMSGFTCEHGERYDLFGSGGGARLAADIGAPLLAQIPLQPAISAGSDRGQPAALDHGEAAESFATLVDAVLDVAPVVEMQACTARMLEAVETALVAKAAPT